MFKLLYKKNFGKFKLNYRRPILWYKFIDPNNDLLEAETINIFKIWLKFFLHSNWNLLNLTQDKFYYRFWYNMWILVISRRSSFKFPTFSYFVNVNFSFILRDRYCMIFMLKLYLCHRKRKINKQTKKHNSQRLKSLKACTNKCKFWSLFIYLFT